MVASNPVVGAPVSGPQVESVVRAHVTLQSEGEPDEAAGPGERARLRPAGDLGFNHAIVEFEALDHRSAHLGYTKDAVVYWTPGSTGPPGCRPVARDHRRRRPAPTRHLTAVLLATPASARQGGAAPASGAQSAGQPTTIQAALANDVGTLADKFTGLARVMAGKYEWRPSPGVRSVGDVFNLIVMENRMLAGLLTGAGAQGGGGMGGRGNQVTDPAQLEEALRTSYDALKQALSGLSDSDLKANVKMFGRETIKQGAALMLLFGRHEHLGQSMAYARSNSVAPPWSK